MVSTINIPGTVKPAQRSLASSVVLRMARWQLVLALMSGAFFLSGVSLGTL
ncbi:MAG: hypothetical protein VW985_08715 [Gammaproteobacteria bacterium]